MKRRMRKLTRRVNHRDRPQTKKTKTTKTTKKIQKKNPYQSEKKRDKVV